MPRFTNVLYHCIFKSKNRKDSDSDLHCSDDYSSGMSSEDKQLMTKLDCYLSTPVRNGPGGFCYTQNMLVTHWLKLLAT